MSIFVGYEPARSCTGGPEDGARELMSWWLGAYGHLGATNLGIYNCRDVRGGNTTSLHGEGRAGDLGVNPDAAGYGWEAADLLRLNSHELGIQCIIWDRHIWSGSYPHAGWRDYRGSNPHVDHLHVELSRWMADRLTAEHIVAVLGGGAATPGSTAPETDGVRNLRLTDPWMRGDDVETVQRVLNAWYRVARPGWWRLAEDGVYGPRTTRAVKYMQDRARITVDGIVGPQTRAVLGL